MARYMQVAADANEVAKQLYNLVPPEHQVEAAQLIAKLVNYGVRCSPRGVQHTVRRNAVERAVQGLPIKIGMKVVTKPGGFSFNAITYNGVADSDSGDE